MTEFMEWLEANQEHFKTYSNQEIADIAIASGQDRAAVAQWLTQKRFKAA